MERFDAINEPDRCDQRKELEEAMEKIMKKLVPAVLVMAAVLCLGACGKSSAVKAVEDSINAIGEVTVDSKDAIKAAEDAYAALSDSDKSKVENYGTLTAAKDSLFRTQLADYTKQMTEVSDSCAYVTEFIRLTWENLGVDNVMHALNCAEFFTQPDLTPENYVTVFNTIAEENKYTVDDVKTLLWGAARGVCPEELDSNGLKFTSDEGVQKAIRYCGLYCQAKEKISKAQEELFPAVKDFKNAYSADYSIVNDLNEWLIELDLYSDFALDPSGSLSSYTTSKDEYEEKMKRFQKTLAAF